MVKQTIRHACGLIALLHGVSNGGAKEYITAGSDLDMLLKEASPLKPAARADLLYNSHSLKEAHMAAAQKGDSKALSSEEDNGFHYICFVKGDDGHLRELNAGMKGPVARGVLRPDEDALSKQALRVGLKTFLQYAGAEDLEFSIVALVPSID